MALGAFAGTNVDNLVTLSGQMAASDPSRHRRIASGQLTATALVIFLCAVGGIGLNAVPRHLLGLLGLIPIALGVRGIVLLIRRQRDDRSMPVAGGYFSALGVTLAISGDNVAVYLPILAIGSVATGAVSIGIWLLADLVLIAVAGWLGRHQAVRSALAWIGPVALPLIYLIVGVVVLVRAGTFM